MRNIKTLTLYFPHGASIKECESIVQYAENEIMAGVSEGGMATINKYGIYVEDVKFSEDSMMYVFGHNRLQDNSQEKCPLCHSTNFAIVRDMTSRRTCSTCNTEWKCPK